MQPAAPSSGGFAEAHPNCGAWAVSRSGRGRGSNPAGNVWSWGGSRNGGGPRGARVWGDGGREGERLPPEIEMPPEGSAHPRATPFLGYVCICPSPLAPLCHPSTLIHPLCTPLSAPMPPSIHLSSWAHTRPLPTPLSIGPSCPRGAAAPKLFTSPSAEPVSARPYTLPHWAPAPLLPPRSSAQLASQNQPPGGAPHPLQGPPAALPGCGEPRGSPPTAASAHCPCWVPGWSVPSLGGFIAPWQVANGRPRF